MGYRSDVGICWKVDDYKKFEQEFKKNKEDDKWLLFKWIDETHKANGGKYVITIWRRVKWYTDDVEYYPDVNWIEELRKSHTSLFVRIGEENEDIEIDHNETDEDDGESFKMECFLNVKRELEISKGN